VIKLEYSGDGKSAAGVKVYVDGGRVYRVCEINTDESRENMTVKRDGDAIYVEFEADVEWKYENGNKKMFLRNIKEVNPREGERGCPEKMLQ